MKGETVQFSSVHAEKCLNGCLDDIELGFVEREATSRLLMKLVFSSILLDCLFRI